MLDGCVCNLTYCYPSLMEGGGHDILYNYYYEAGLSHL